MNSNMALAITSDDFGGLDSSVIATEMMRRNISHAVHLIAIFVKIL